MQKLLIPGLLLLAGVLPYSSLNARELCRARLDCPPDFDGDTAYVDYDAVMLAEIFEHCAPDSVKEGIIDTAKDTVSLFVIIDQSSSMKVMDPCATRYSVASNLIDSIYKYSPASEIGIAIFSNKLLHNYEDDTFFDQLDNSQARGWNDSYVPLTRLDTQVNGMSAVDKLKWAIALSDTALDPGGNRLLLNGDYGTSGRKPYTGGTDISLGFEAAKEAFLSAIYEPKRRFIVFLSDGVHQLIDTARQPYATDYIEGQGIPTTFTAFFINQGQPIPDEINTMTLNIQNNGYSENNIYSDVWGTQSNVNTFLEKIMTNVIGDGLKYFTSTPVSMTINGITTSTFDDTFAFFDTIFAPFNKNGEVTLNVSYTCHWNDPIDKDVTKTYAIHVKHGNIPDLESVDCWNQGRIYFYDTSGNNITVAGPSQTLLEVRFFPPDSGNFPPLGNTVNLELTNADGSDILNLTLQLDQVTQTYYSTTFMRDYGTPVMDAILQNSNTDSIIATYRNPVIPLDTVRYGINVLPLLDLTVTSAGYLDQNANGHPDLITVAQGGGQVLTAADCNLLNPFTSIASPRNVGAPLSLVPAIKGFNIAISEPLIALPGKTDLYQDATNAVNERLYINAGSTMLSSCSYFPFTNTTIMDKMAPVINSAPYYDFPGTIDWDTLKIIFSEDVSSIVHNQPFVFKSLLLDSSFYLNVARVRTDSNIVVFRVQPDPAAPAVQPGDSISINSTAMVADRNSNMQSSPDNIRRPLTYYHVYKLETVIYLDTYSHPDGLIDVIHVKTNVVPDTAMINALISNGSLKLPEHQNFTVKGIVQTDSGFSILVTQPVGTTPVTDINPLLDSLWGCTTISSTNGIIFQTTLPIIDEIPPVITKAILCPKFIEKEGQAVYDTLKITFSEEVKNPPYNTNEPFHFSYVSGGQTYTMVLQPLASEDNGKVQTFLVLSSTKDFPENGDPVWINELAGISDLTGNVQDNPNNKSVPLQVGPYKFVTEVDITSNPVTSFNNTIVIDNVSGKGAAIVVKVIGGWPTTVTMTGLMHIFDAVGNTITETTGIPSPNNTSVLFFWDGVNEYKRKVSDGIYLCLVKLKSSQGENVSTTFKVGVNRYIEQY